MNEKNSKEYLYAKIFKMFFYQSPNYGCLELQIEALKYKRLK